MGTRMLLNVIVRENGKRYYTDQYFFSNDLSNDEIIEAVINKTNFYYNAGRKVFIVNERAKKAIDAGKFIIEHTKE